MKPLPPRSPAEVAEAYPAYRQSLLGSFDACPLATRFKLEGFDWMGAEAARGIIFHQWAARYIAQLKAMGERRMSTEEALVLLREVEGQAGVPADQVVHVPSSERAILRIAVIKFCEKELSIERVVAVEERLFATVVYANEHGERIERTISGRPDCLIADPPDGIIVPDWKTTRSPPPRPAQPGLDDPLSPEGYYQQKIYFLLCVRSYAKVNHVTLREYYPLAGEAREATLTRSDDLEHVEHDVGLTVQELDRALAGGSKSELWMPQPGRHCRYCPRPIDCPVDVADRPVATPLDASVATDYAGRFLALDNRRAWLRESLREHVSEHGPLDVASEKGDYQLRWKVHPETGRRAFGLWPREEAA